MKSDQKSLCVFIHFSTEKTVPHYVQVFADELSLTFDRVIIATNHRVKKTVFDVFAPNVEVLQFKNEGYDLGMFYKVFQIIHPEEYHQIACINDSNILFNKLSPVFSWSRNFNFDFWGMIDSSEKPWFSTHTDNYHIQSHFIVFNQRAIKMLSTYFGLLNMDKIFRIDDPKKLRQTVINEWEIGLSQFLLKNGLKSGSYIQSERFIDLHLSGKAGNVTHKLYPELIQSGYPLIKKKVISKGRWFENFNPKTHWELMVGNYGNPNWNMSRLISEMVKLENNKRHRKLRQFSARVNFTYNRIFRKGIV